MKATTLSKSEGKLVVEYTAGNAMEAIGLASAEIGAVDEHVSMSITSSYDFTAKADVARLLLNGASFPTNDLVSGVVGRQS